MTPEDALAQAAPDAAMVHGGAMVEGSMTQGAGQGPVVNASVSWRPPQPPQQQPVPSGSELPQAPAAAGFPEAPLPENPAPGGPFPQTPFPDAPAPGPEPVPAAPPGAEAPASASASASASEPAERATAAQDLPAPQHTRDSPTVQLTSLGDAEQEDGPPGPLYVVGDVHGYLGELRAELQAHDLIDAEGHWSAGPARLWFLGDFTDRGPDGVGVLDLVMQLSAEAAAAGGYAKALMGNHELLLMGAKKFGDTPVNSAAGTASFLAAWRLNGGQPSDMERLEDHHLAWMSRLDAVALEDAHLLLHSDTTAYLDYGSSIDAVNDAVTGILQRGDADECWELFRKFTKRFAFRGDTGAESARELLDAYGGRQVVHGHSPIPYLLGEVGAEDEEEGGAPKVSGPHVYADDLAVAMDGGVTMDGRLLVAQLPLPV